MQKEAVGSQTRIRNFFTMGEIAVIRRFTIRDTGTLMKVFYGGFWGYDGGRFYASADRPCNLSFKVDWQTRGFGFGCGTIRAFMEQMRDVSLEELDMMDEDTFHEVNVEATRLAMNDSD